MKKIIKTVLRCAGAIAIALAVGALASWLAGDSAGIYAALKKPPLSPPGWAFAVVWPVLYALMGLSSGLVAGNPGPGREDALFTYGAQLFVNFWWPVFFFRLGIYLAAFFWLLLLLVLVGIMILRFWRIEKTAGWLNVPYALWLCYAAYLNLGVWLLNK